MNQHQQNLQFQPSQEGCYAQSNTQQIYQQQRHTSAVPQTVPGPRYIIQSVHPPNHNFTSHPHFQTVANGPPPFANHQGGSQYFVTRPNPTENLTNPRFRLQDQHVDSGGLRVLHHQPVNVVGSEAMVNRDSSGVVLVAHPGANNTSSFIHQKPRFIMNGPNSHNVSVQQQHFQMLPHNQAASQLNNHHSPSIHTLISSTSPPKQPNHQNVVHQQRQPNLTSHQGVTALVFNEGSVMSNNLHCPPASPRFVMGNTAVDGKKALSGGNDHHPKGYTQSAIDCTTNIVYNIEHIFEENGCEARKMPVKDGNETLWIDPSAGRPNRYTNAIGDSSNIVYNVEHVFEENGREVKKMPVKFGNETLWVDCCDTSSPTPDKVTSTSSSFGVQSTSSGCGSQILLDVKGESFTTTQSPVSMTSSTGNCTTSKVSSWAPTSRNSKNDYRPMFMSAQPPPAPRLPQPMFGSSSQNQNGGVTSNTQTPHPRFKKVNDEELDKSVSKILSGEETIVNVAKQFGIPVRRVKGRLDRRLLVNSQNKNQQPCGVPSQIVSDNNGNNNSTQPTVVPQTIIIPHVNPTPITYTSGPPLIVNGSRGPMTLTVPTVASSIQQQQQTAGPGIGAALRLQSVSLTGDGGSQIQLQQGRQGGLFIPVGNFTSSEEPPRTKSQQIHQSIITTTETKAYQPILKPGKLCVCKHCGELGPDFNLCTRCKKKIPEDCKVVVDGKVSSKAAVCSGPPLMINSSCGPPLRGLTTASNNISARVNQRNNLMVGVGVGGVSNVRNKTQNQNHPSNEPVCIALSSDEEEEKQKRDEGGNGGSALPSNISSSCEASSNQQGSDGSAKSVVVAADSSIASVARHVNIEPELSVRDILGNDPPYRVDIELRTCRIGSYRCHPLTLGRKVYFTSYGMHTIVPDIMDETKKVLINIANGDVVKICVCFRRSLTQFLISLTESACKTIRRQLQMESVEHGIWFDINSESVVNQRMIFLGNNINSPMATLSTLKNIFGTRLIEMSGHVANEELVDCSLTDYERKKCLGVYIAYRNRLKTTQNSSTDHQQTSLQQQATATATLESNSDRLAKYCQLPFPQTIDYVSVTEDDYICLEDESFLNDSIIDFYMRYIQCHLMTEIDKKRTHIFSTYFYRRLTTKPKNLKAHPNETSRVLSASEKRYERVKRWTKKVNLFEKDFVIVPINEHSHWYLAIICFPGVEGCRRMDDNSFVSQIQQSSTTTSKRCLNVGGNKNRSLVKVKTTTSTIIKPIIQSGNEGNNFTSSSLGVGDDSDSRDEADASDDDMIAPHQTLQTTTTQALSSSKSPDQNETMSAESVKSMLDEEETSMKNTTSSSSIDDNSISHKQLKNVDSNVKVDIKQPCILIFDSLTTTSRARVAATLRDYLTCEHKTKMGKPRLFDKSNMKGHSPKTPQQPNFSDCGIFLLQYCESFFSKPIKSYELPIRHLRHWFTRDNVRHKRSEIATIIRDLSKEQNPNKNITFPNIRFSPTSGSGYTDDDDEEEEKDSGDNRNDQTYEPSEDRENVDGVVKSTATDQMQKSEDNEQKQSEGVSNETRSAVEDPEVKRDENSDPQNEMSDDVEGKKDSTALKLLSSNYDSSPSSSSSSEEGGGGEGASESGGQLDPTREVGSNVVTDDNETMSDEHVEGELRGGGDNEMNDSSSKRLRLNSPIPQESSSPVIHPEHDVNSDS